MYAVKDHTLHSYSIVHIRNVIAQVNECSKVTGGLVIT